MFEDYFNVLHTRRDTAERLSFRKVETADWKPGRACCHLNVDHCVCLYPHLKAVRGWLIPWCREDGSCRFQAHSVIEDGGKLFDITLMNQANCDAERFLRHEGKADFFTVAKAYPLRDWPPPPQEPEEGMVEDREDGPTY